MTSDRLGSGSPGGRVISQRVDPNPTARRTQGLGPATTASCRASDAGKRQQSLRR